MITHQERILRVARGEMVDKIPYVPRIDLWYNANLRSGTLPDRHKHRTADEIALAEGWALHKVVPEFLKPEKTEDIVHRGLGLFRLKEFTYTFNFASDVEIQADGDQDHMRVVYATSLGSVSVTHGYTEEMKNAGASVPWIQEHAIKGPDDYKVLAHIFGNMTFEPDYERFAKWEAEIGANGIAVEHSIALNAGSPMRFIQKVLIDATDFFLHYNDYHKEMQALVEALAHCYNQLLPILANSPAKATLWDSNVDSMITYPDYFRRDILPWWQKAAEVLHGKGKLMMLHPDGENNRLMDLLADCGADVCEAVTPFPMTKVTLDEYYDKWCRSDKLTIWGGIPESMLLEKSTTDADFEAFLDHLFKVIVPGKRFIAGIGDTTPPGAVFDRLVRMGERFEKEGRLPLKAGATRFVAPTELESIPKPIALGRLGQIPSGVAETQTLRATAQIGPVREEDENLLTIQADVLKGDNNKIKQDVQHLLEMNYTPQDILNRGMLSAMEIIGSRFKDGTVFIPEVLLSARALNEALTILEPLLSIDNKSHLGKILIGTVRGDLHDIGKNLVSTMLKGVGFDVVDLGINVSVDEFVKQVSHHHPDLLGMSALLTTTMPQMKSVIDALIRAELRSDLKVMVGGAPVNEKFAKDIGADGYAQDAGDAVDLARRLLAGH